MAENSAVELRHLRTFATIAETLNFSRAAALLHVTQPALSRQMRDLEAEVRRNLFDRVSNGVRLTTAGREFLVGARRVLAASDALLAHMLGRDGSPRPPLKIAHFGALSAQYFSPFIHRLHRRYPGANLQIEEYLPGESLAALRAGKLDAAFSGPPEPSRLRGLDARTVWRVPQEIFVPANHALAKRRRLALAELRRDRWALWSEKDFPGFGRTCVAACRAAGFRPRVAGTVDSLASMLIHVAESKYISYGPPVARTLPHQGVAFIPTDPPGVIDVHVLLVWRRDSPHLEAIRWLADAMEATTRSAGKS
jgi:DNA-binding transcriptional LysR family regulator